MIVYVDVLIGLNFIVNYLLLLISARLCGAGLSRGRIALGALVGALASLTIFLPEQGAGITIAFKLALTAALAAISGGYHGLGGYFKRLLMLFAASFVFAGGMLCYTLLLGGGAGFYQNGVCYFRISALQLVAFSAAAYGGLTLCQRFFKRGMAAAPEYRVRLVVGDVTAELAGVMDSQNNLLDLFTGTPVVIGTLPLLGEAVPPAVRAAAQSGLARVVTGEGLRLIPCTTVGGQEVLPAFRPDKMVLLGPAGEELEVGDVYIAVSTKLSGPDAKKLILNPALAGRPVKAQKK